MRHSAPFGFRLTLDARRGIAVRGALVTANYPDFNRVDLDLRAYDTPADYDLTLHVRPAAPGAADVRTVAFALSGERIRHDKPAFDDPFVTVRFPPIADSAGQRYYVWVEPGPRNRDNVLALWSLKSYSEVSGREVLAAFLADPPGDRAPGLVRASLLAALIGFAAAVGWLVGALVGLATPAAHPAVAGEAAPRPAGLPSGTVAGADPAGSCRFAVIARRALRRASFVRSYRRTGGRGRPRRDGGRTAGERRCRWTLVRT